MTARWTSDDVPGQHGRLAVVTGANTGLGFETARVLAARGASVVLAVRDTEKGKRAAARIAARRPRRERHGPAPRPGLPGFHPRRRRRTAGQHPRIDLLINNAGVMFPPKQTTPDGFELQLGTNHLGHFALTGLLLEQMLPVPGSRVVTVSSLAHRIRARINFDDLQSERSYNRVAAYSQSKLANLTVHLRAAAPAVRRGHHHRGRRPPGPRRHRAVPRHARDRRVRLRAADKPEPAMGALPVLRAATDPACSAASTTARADSLGAGATRNWPIPAPIPRHGRPAPPVDSLRRTDRGHLPGLTRPRPTAGRIVMPQRPAGQPRGGTGYGGTTMQRRHNYFSLPGQSLTLSHEQPS